MAPVMKPTNMSMEKTWDLLTSFAEIMNVPTDDLIRLLRPKVAKQCSNPHRVQSGRVGKHSASKRVRRVTVDGSYSPESYNSSEDALADSGLDSDSQCLDSDSDQFDSDMDSNSCEAWQVSEIPPVSSEPQEPCGTAPVAVEYIYDTDPRVFCAAQEEVVCGDSTQAPEQLDDTLDFLHPHLAHCHVVTISTEH